MSTAHEQRSQVNLQGSSFLPVRKFNNMVKEKGKAHRAFLKVLLDNTVGFSIKQLKGLLQKSKFKGIRGRKTFWSWLQSVALAQGHWTLWSLWGHEFSTWINRRPLSCRDRAGFLSRLKICPMMFTSHCQESISHSPDSLGQSPLWISTL